MITSTLGSGSCKEAARLEANPRRKTIFFHVLFKDGGHLGQIETHAIEMRVLERDLHHQVALRCSAIGHGFVIGPGELLRDGEIRPAAHAGHGAQKRLKPGRIGIERGKDVRFTRLFALPFPRAKRKGEAAPMPVEALVCHLQNAADIGRLALVQKQVRRRRVAIVAILALQESQSDQRVEKVSGGTRMKAKTSGQCMPFFGAAGKFGEHFHLHGAEQSL